jgi:hypothetical protein
MLEKLALLKMALCSALALTIDSSVCPCAVMPASDADLLSAPVSVFEMEMGYPNLMMAVTDCQGRSRNLVEKLADGESKLCGRVRLLEELTAFHEGVRRQSGQGRPGCI